MLGDPKATKFAGPNLDSLRTMNARYEYSDGGSSKFWAVSVVGTTITTQWGRIGTKGQTKKVECDTPSHAKSEAAKAAAKKVKKGYQKVGADKPTTSKPKSKSLAKKPTSPKRMDAKSFERAMRQKFKFDKGGSFVGAGDKTMLGFQRPNETFKYHLRTFCVIPVTDTDTHFKAMAILDGDANEFVHISEPGEHFNRVFWNDHEEGLYSIDCMSDYEDELDMDEYEGLSKDERIEWMPFYQHPIADSLEEFFAGIQAFTREEFWEEDESEDSGKSDGAGHGFEIDAEECWARLCDAELAPKSLDVLGWLIDRLEDETILWVDQPWAELDYEELTTDAAVGLVVFTEPVDVDGPLTLSAEMLLGDTTLRDERGFLFLDEVRCESFLTLSDAVAVFAGGLVAEKFACFAAPDATTHVGKLLESEFVVSGHGAGNVSLWPRTEWKVKAMDGYVGGLASAAEVLSFDAETIEDDSVNSVIANLADGYSKVPKTFRFPRRPPRKSPKAKKGPVLRMDASAFEVFLDYRIVSEGSRALFRGSVDYFFSNPDAFALVAPDLKTAHAAEDAENATVVVITQPLSTKDSLQLRSLGGGDEWFGYWFCEPVSCLDVSLNFNGLAVFQSGLNARIVSTAKADCHLRVEKHLECSVQCGAADVANGTSIEVGAITGYVSGSAKTEVALPSLAHEIEDEGSVWRVMLEHFDDLPKLSSQPTASAGVSPGSKPRAAKKKKNAGLAGKSVCVTGTFTEKRAVLHARIKAAGGEVHTSVRATTDYLLAGDKTGAAKRSAAAKQGAKVIDAEAFDALLDG